MRTSRIVATTACVIGMFVAPVRAQSSGDIAARIAQLEDTQEIQRLLLNYGRPLDARDFKAYSLLFAKDGVWSGGRAWALEVQAPSCVERHSRERSAPYNGSVRL